MSWWTKGLRSIGRALGFLPSREEEEIMEEMRRLVEQQRERAGLLSPQFTELQRALMERELKAIKGELPVSPALERSIGEQKQLLEEQLSAKLGPNWRQTTPGIQALSEFEKRAEDLREAARRGMMITSANLLTQTAGLSPEAGLFPYYGYLLRPYGEFGARRAQAVSGLLQMAGLGAGMALGSGAGGGAMAGAGAAPAASAGGAGLLGGGPTLLT